MINEFVSTKRGQCLVTTGIIQIPIFAGNLQGLQCKVKPLDRACLLQDLKLPRVLRRNLLKLQSHVLWFMSGLQELVHLLQLLEIDLNVLCFWPLEFASCGSRGDVAELQNPEMLRLMPVKWPSGQLGFHQLLELLRLALVPLERLSSFGAVGLPLLYWLIILGLLSSVVNMGIRPTRSNPWVCWKFTGCRTGGRLHFSTLRRSLTRLFLDDMMACKPLSPHRVGLRTLLLLILRGLMANRPSFWGLGCRGH